jgi:phosphatidylglycerophosphate synthase
MPSGTLTLPWRGRVDAEQSEASGWGELSKVHPPPGGGGRGAGPPPGGARPRPWSHVVTSGGSRSLVEALAPESPVVVVAPDTIPEPGELRNVLARALAQPRPSAWIWRRVPVAAYYPEALELLAQVARGSELLPPESPRTTATPRVEVTSDGWNNVKGADGTQAAEGRLFRSLRQPSDGYLARFDRAISIALSRVLVRTPLTPNVITALSLVVGLAGAALLATTTLGTAVLGSLLLWVSCILDGCDGEVARLKLRMSPFGARFDRAVDDVIHLATFGAIAVHVHRTRPDLSLTGPALLSFLGVVVSMTSVWWLINRLPSEQRLGFKRVYERVASRDYVYLVVILTAVSRLEWFLWAVAIGANLFWLSLWGWARVTRSR